MRVHTAAVTCCAASNSHPAALLATPFLAKRYSHDFTPQRWAPWFRLLFFPFILAVVAVGLIAFRRSNRLLLTIVSRTQTTVALSVSILWNVYLVVFGSVASNGDDLGISPTELRCNSVKATQTLGGNSIWDSVLYTVSLAGLLHWQAYLLGFYCVAARRKAMDQKREENTELQNTQYDKKEVIPLSEVLSRLPEPKGTSREMSAIKERYVSGFARKNEEKNPKVFEKPIEKELQNQQKWAFNVNFPIEE